MSINLKAILSRKLRALFTDEAERVKAEAILLRYGLESHQPEPDRVRLAILKLACQAKGADLQELESCTKDGGDDYRDILSWSEYPRESKKWSMPEGSKKRKIRAQDRAEYEEWLDE